MENNTVNTYRKLPDGSWGINVTTGNVAGDTVTVTLKSGATKTETLGNPLGASLYGGYLYTVAARPQPATVAVGEMSGMLALFGKAKQHLKYPAVVLSVPAASMTVRLSVAGDRAKIPGSITVLDYDAGPDGRDWLGRITVDGQYQPSRKTNGRTDAIVARLQQFACDPATVAAEHGRLTGRCCFCNLPLKDERSTAVGYGATCASHYGLPWGARPATFADPVR